MKRDNGKFTKTLAGEKKTTCLLLRTSTISSLRAVAESKGLSLSETVDLLIQGSPDSAQDPKSIGTTLKNPIGKPKYAI